jgi:diaminopimelate epimerase
MMAADGETVPSSDRRVDGCGVGDRPAVRVVKAHGYRNDFLLVPEGDIESLDRPALARRMCDRHAGIGADGLITYRVGAQATSMRLFNADGSEAEVSGNGVRCLAALLVRDGVAASPVTIETSAGSKALTLIQRAPNRWTFRASMGQPRDIRALDLEAAGERVRAVALSVGNPQCAVLGGPLNLERFQRLGPALERHPAFPNRTNVSFVNVEAPDRIRVLIWERGVGPTEASGTGACGAAVAAAVHGGASRDVQVISPGGAQRVEWTGDGLYLTGWAELVCEGSWLAVSA